MKTWNEKLKSLRIDNRLTQEEVAEKINVSRCSLANYELGRRKPTVEIFAKFAKFYNVSVDYLSGKLEEDSHSSYFKEQAEMFFMSEKITTEDKELILQDIMDLYFRGKKQGAKDKKNNKKDPKENE